MDANVKAKWLTALRSGEFKQTRGILHAEAADGTESFCCIGVLCEIGYQEGKVNRRPTGNGSGLNFYYGDSDSVAPHAVQMWAKLDSECGMLPVWIDENLNVYDDKTRFDAPTFTTNYLTEANDILSLSFEQIADLIEKYL